MPSDLFNFSKREVICADALKWLKENKNHRAIITSLPDMEEVGFGLEKWKQWISETVSIIIDSLHKESVAIFYQTNRKYQGYLIDKDYLISNEFYKRGYNKVFQKIVLKQRPGTINLFRPSYSNLFAFSKQIKAGKATPCVIEAGKMVYKNAMGINACTVAVEFIKQKIYTDIILDPFCGMGSILAIANKLGYNSIGVDISSEQTKKAKALII